MHTFGAAPPSIDYVDEIDFWSRQLSEHALFSHLGLQDQPLRIRAMELHQQWEAFRQSRSGLPSREVSGRALALALDTRSFLSHVHERLVKGQWLGWLFPLFVDHIRREGDYFIDILQHKTLAAEDVCKTWIVFMAEHAAFAAHLLDPTEAQKIRQATAFIGSFEKLHAGCNAINDQLLVMTTQAGKELDQYFTHLDVGSPRLKSIIHPALAKHVIREGQRFLTTVDQLKTQIASTALYGSLA
jgi:hypothetical protein